MILGGVVCRVLRGAQLLTICDIWWRKVVIDKKGSMFGHAQVNNIRSGLQGSHCILVSYLLQAGAIHLMNTTVGCNGYNVYHFYLVSGEKVSHSNKFVAYL